MEMSLHQSNGSLFTNYSDSSITINNKEYKTNIIVTNTEIISLQVNNINSLTLDHLDKIIQDKPDLIIFGTGDKISYPAEYKLLEKLGELGIGFEIMPIQALCRTYNFLISEDRKLACILFFTQ